VPQVALAFTLGQPLDLFALVGCQSGDEFVANVAASSIRQSSEELEWLDLLRDER
jgi:aryl-alcohol dehydrogenase-like predicted oxidoreductase